MPEVLRIVAPFESGFDKDDNPVETIKHPADFPDIMPAQGIMVHACVSQSQNLHETFEHPQKHVVLAHDQETTTIVDKVPYDLIKGFSFFHCMLTTTTRKNTLPFNTDE
ncbi:hypothetical protein DPF_1442 [Desulfoplanes formicivorans]|uniref:Uncharacterized protein n=1 Tax=Desulfoplanes formicivorans TaxID=1592317 RepID=A0A194AI27_9BACT|nr:hypothetical protein DPF_1442 [Desulfoplanes formicivorans]